MDGVATTGHAAGHQATEARPAAADGGAGPGAGPAARRSAARPLALALAAGAFGARLVATGERTGITAGIALLILALGAAAVAIGGRPYGAEAEGPLDLSARIALGLLGGALAGLAHGVLQWLAVTSLLDLSGAGFAAGLASAAWAARCGVGAALGLGFGLLLPVLPGRSHVAKAAWLSLLPTFYVLLYHFPVVLGAGLLGVRLGPLTGVAAALLNLAAATVAGVVMTWGERSELGPLSRPLVE